MEGVSSAPSIDHDEPMGHSYAEASVEFASERTSQQPSSFDDFELFNTDGIDQQGFLPDFVLSSDVDVCSSTDAEPVYDVSSFVSVDATVRSMRTFSMSDAVAERQMAVRNIVKTLENVCHDEEAVNAVFRLAENTFAEDSEAAVRIELLEQLPVVAMLCTQVKTLACCIDQWIVPMMIKLVSDVYPQVRRTCDQAIVLLLEQGLLSSTNIELALLPALYEAVEQSPIEEVRIEAIDLIIKLAQNMTQDKVLDLILPKFVSYCRDTAICVRKSCAARMGDISRLVSRDVVERVLMFHLIALSQDPIWGVRKSCVECMPDFAAICCMRARWQHLTPVYLVLLSDSNQWVRYSAQQFLGPFIATFANPARTGLKCVGDYVVYDESAVRPPDENEADHMGACSPDLCTLSSQVDPSHMELSSLLENPVAPASQNVLRMVDERTLNKKADEAVSLETHREDPLCSGTQAVPMSPVPKGGNSDELQEHCSSNAKLAGRSSELRALSVANNEDETMNSCADMIAETKRNERTDTCSLEIAGDLNEVTVRSSPCNYNSSEQQPVIIALEAARQEIVPHALLDSYLAMPNAEPMQSMENDVPRHCAHSFPAVALTLGRSNWHLLRTAYHALVVNSWWKVRRAIAFSLHLLAVIVGPGPTVEDLLPTFICFIRDLDEVRLGILEHMDKFLMLLDRSSCRKVLCHLANFLQNDSASNWRFRYLFAEQLIKICNLFGIEDLNEYFSPIAMTLAIDRVAEVRFFTCKLIARILKCLYVGEKASNKPKTLLTDSFAQDIVKSFACSVKFLRRQTFARICGEILEQQAVGIDDFGRLFLPAFNELLVDKVTNVRITAACILSEHCVTMRRMNPLETFNAMVSDLASDKDVNVRFFLENMFQNGNVSEYPRANHGI
ncbi:hypothetical protein M514_02751 [Trichuris suis]|uniref:HEAT repeat protein n=1 Tax=Trichuris suis TaxID=68888 RepID=A0A085NH26_9BILA|nr:hypothetical protein M513_02751 [Trichuris suis]KFD68772.1 hypothetical protein M514_02751 [Trichuris suis]